VQAKPDGSLQVGGLVGRRLEEARKQLVENGRFIPLDRFVRLGERGFTNSNDQIHLRYQEAEALAVFLMQAHGGRYREEFLDYVKDAYRGRLKRTTGLALDDRLGVSYAQLGTELLEYLKKGPATPR
jgi:hypothetical protein